MTTMLRWSPTRRAWPLIDSVPGEIDAQGMRLIRRVVFPLVPGIDRHRIAEIRPGRIRLVSCFQMVREMGVGRRGDRERSYMGNMAGFLLLSGGDHSFPPFDNRLLHRYRSMNAVEFMVQALAQLSFFCIGAPRKQGKSLPHALHMVRPPSSRRHSGVMVVPQF